MRKGFAARVALLLVALQVERVLDLSVFPSILLFVTLLRLALNVASTRLILTHAGKDGLSAAGGVIQAFGDFVAGEPIHGTFEMKIDEAALMARQAQLGWPAARSMATLPFSPMTSTRATTCCCRSSSKASSRATAARSSAPRW